MLSEISRLFSYSGLAMSKLGRIRQLALGDWIVLPQLIASAFIVVLALKAFGWQRVARSIQSRSRGSRLRHLPFLHLRYSMDDLVPLVDMASSIFPRNRCLVRSMMMLWLLRARGERAELVLGVRKRAGNFEAHAWTVSGQEPIGESAEAIEQFNVIARSETYPET